MKHNARRSGSPTDEEIRAAAEAMQVDARSVVRALAGLPVRGKAGERAESAAAAIRGKYPESTPPSGRDA
jgi:hypothetical protein